MAASPPTSVPAMAAAVSTVAAAVSLLAYAYKVTHQFDSYIPLQSIWGVPLACLMGSS